MNHEIKEKPVHIDDLPDIEKKLISRVSTMVEGIHKLFSEHNASVDEALSTLMSVSMHMVYAGIISDHEMADHLQAFANNLRSSVSNRTVQ